MGAWGQGEEVYLERKGDTGIRRAKEEKKDGVEMCFRLLVKY